jgi:hypothetical protein
MQGWYKYQHGVQACPAFNKKGKFLWWIITIHIRVRPVLVETTKTDKMPSKHMFSG